jgi:hypothetical protein
MLKRNEPPAAEAISEASAKKLKTICDLEEYDLKTETTTVNKNYQALITENTLLALMDQPDSSPTPSTSTNTSPNQTESDSKSVAHALTESNLALSERAHSTNASSANKHTNSSSSVDGHYGRYRDQGDTASSKCSSRQQRYNFGDDEANSNSSSGSNSTSSNDEVEWYERHRKSANRSKSEAERPRKSDENSDESSSDDSNSASCYSERASSSRNAPGAAAILSSAMLSAPNANNENLNAAFYPSMIRRSRSNTMASSHTVIHSKLFADLSASPCTSTSTNANRTCASQIEESDEKQRESPDVDLPGEPKLRSDSFDATSEDDKMRPARIRLSNFEAKSRHFDKVRNHAYELTLRANSKSR